MADSLYLSSEWSVFFHDYENTNWSHESYEMLVVLRTIPQFWTFLEIIRNKLQAGMFFVMKDDHFPRWDADIEGDSRYHFMSVKVIKAKVESCAEYILTRLLAEQLYPPNPSAVRGVSISPKKHFCIFKVWLVTDNIEEVRENEAAFDLPKYYHGSIMFKDA